MQGHKRSLLIFGPVVTAVMVLITISSAVPALHNREHAALPGTVAIYQHDQVRPPGERQRSTAIDETQCQRSKNEL